MNERLKQLMEEAGYAAPELAGRAKMLAELLLRDVIDIADNCVHGDEAASRIKQEFGLN